MPMPSEYRASASASASASIRSGANGIRHAKGGESADDYAAAAAGMASPSSGSVGRPASPRRLTVLSSTRGGGQAASLPPSEQGGFSTARTSPVQDVATSPQHRASLNRFERAGSSSGQARRQDATVTPGDGQEMC